MARIALFSDLEGVFVPEIWPAIGNRLSIPELSLTTRDTPDFKRLMKMRLDALNKHHISFSMVMSALDGVRPFNNAVDTMREISEIDGIDPIIISDSFKEFIDKILGKLHGWTVFANKFHVEDDIIRDCVFTVGGDKARIFEDNMHRGDKTIAIGDSFNDVGMLKKANSKILFNPIWELRTVLTDAVVCDSMDSLLSVIKRLANT
ncbi:bifunctional phosphoserine phosphatase/homoserine phosphotransferase ThrH [Candidatus Parvarchaeota archaeon]|nr:bifunctional phosphoserine phosphatase/homoserine phosphotransferase ThrH [Candidatus Parvarchaeota archaeon]